eukprot:13327256-Alexandrium_andersonii.AAC.1
MATISQLQNRHRSVHPKWTLLAQPHSNRQHSTKQPARVPQQACRSPSQQAQESEDSRLTAMASTAGHHRRNTPNNPAPGPPGALEPPT